MIPILQLQISVSGIFMFKKEVIRMSHSQSNCQYEVLSPWADVDVVPLKGIRPRLTTLAGKKIGLAFNFKTAARPILSVVERILKERFPTCETSWFNILSRNEKSPTDMKIGEAEFAEWIKGLDAVVTAVGD
jgi:hypothetical protein